MASSTKKGPCLVARAVPCPLADTTDEMTARLEQLSVEDTSQKRINKETHNISPSDFVTLQSIRSSALARKTNTTSKFSRGGPALFADLLNKDDKLKKETKVEAKKEETEKVKEKEEEKEEKKKEEKPVEDQNENKESEGELLSRGPVKYERQPRQPNQHHPYHQGIQYGAAALSTVNDPTAFSNYGGGYECGRNTWTDSPENMSYISQSSTPDTMLSDQGYFSNSPCYMSQCQVQPYSEQCHSAQESPEQDAELQLPEQLADFILKFSRQYTISARDEAASPKARPPSADSGVDSPMSARSAPNASPEVPHGGHSGPTTPSFNQTRMSPRKNQNRAAKQALRAAIPEGELEDAWAWALKCYQFAPEALTFQDDDRDSLLHIVTAHRDLGKVYSLVEHHLKMDYDRDQKPFDLPNKSNETPLFLAVVNDSAEVLSYLLEIGCNPNRQTTRGERDSPLHYAAGRGMNKITEILCNERATNLNILNARGQTPLHVAIRNHSAIDEATQAVIDNKKVITTLLKAGADPFCIDATNGRTIFHYAIERMDPDLIDLLRRNIDDEVMTALVNRPDFNGEKPMKLLQQENGADPSKMAMIIPLLTCGAEMK